MDVESALVCEVCAGAAEMRCSGCRLVAYCSKEHQKTHWREHRDVCRPYEVRSSLELGRYLIAARDLLPGEHVLTESPLVFGPKSTPDSEAIMPCVGCYRPVLTECGERCVKCGWPVCSGHCPGLKDPLHHGLECIVLSLRPGCAVNDMADYYRHDALLPLRCLLLQQRAPKKWKKLMEMQSHIDCRAKGTEVYEETDQFIVKYLMDNFLTVLKSVEKDLSKVIIPEWSSEIIHRVCGIIDTNALEIRLSSGSELLGLYTNTCIMEHNCISNTKHTFDLCRTDEDNLYKITVKIVIPVQKDDHITTMYSHALWGTQARRQHLRDTKYFDCKCERCSDPTELGTYLSAMKCLGDGINPCDGIHLPEDPLDEDSEWACNKCLIKVKSDQVNYIISQMGEEVDAVQMVNPSVSMLENLIEKLSTFLHPNHYHLYSLKHSLIQLYGYQQGYLPLQLSDEILEKKIKMCQELTKITNILDPGNARLCLYSGVLQHELHLALVLNVKKAKRDNKVKNEAELRPIIKKAKEALDQASIALEGETIESAGKKLLSLVQETQKAFGKWCSDIIISSILKLFFVINICLRQNNDYARAIGVNVFISYVFK